MGKRLGSDEEEENEEEEEEEEDEEEEGRWGVKAWGFLSRVRDSFPLVQCITNFVSMDLMANTLLAAGASPAMVHALEEVPDFTPHASALLINVGTLTPSWLASMKAAAEIANRLGKPWVLDPVAVSASGFRLRACLELLDLRPAVVRGNASEIIALSGASAGPNKGTDGTHKSIEAIEAAKRLAQTCGAIVAVSGSVDIITDGWQVVGACNGVAMLQRITATGCAVTAIIAAFVAIDPERALDATTAALSVFGVASELGMEKACGPASLRMHLIDSLHGLDKRTVISRVKVKPDLNCP
ncbi:hydroxyethylthiazole kinase [Nymphaea colorata]|nr:hydroxyethylthiazole kinase [Nymphaea colorata]